MSPPTPFPTAAPFFTPEAALRRAQDLVADGAEILDIGGESTRPGALGVSVEQELARVLPVIESIKAQDLDVWISIDTSKAAVARSALASGAMMVNDVTALGDPEMASVVAEFEASIILMHMRGEPRTMQQGEIHYGDLIAEIRDHLAAARERALAAGIPSERVLVDPGIGFGKTVGHNLSITKKLGQFAELQAPIVYGPSRKSFLGAITGHDPGDRDRATAAACAAAIFAGAHVVRVHDVAAVKDAVVVAAAVRDAD